MKYLNQLDHPDIPYPTDAATEGSRFHDLSIKEAGCGLCSLAMMVDRLTTKTISLKRLIAVHPLLALHHSPAPGVKIHHVSTVGITDPKTDHQGCPQDNDDPV